MFVHVLSQVVVPCEGFPTVGICASKWRRMCLHVLSQAVPVSKGLPTAFICANVRTRVDLVMSLKGSLRLEALVKVVSDSALAYCGKSAIGDIPCCSLPNRMIKGPAVV